MSTPHDQIRLKTLTARLFSPRVPIAKTDLFAGRGTQIMKMIQAINQPGAHAIIYGERGVGKTSLANVAPISFAFEEHKPIITPRINCDGTDGYSELWSKVLSEIHVVYEKQPLGLNTAPTEEVRTLLDELNDQPIKPGLVRHVLEDYGRTCHLVVILDEFDRLNAGGNVPRLVADTIKSLSDNETPATVVIVGVGDSISALVRGHESISRHLVEIPLPRMSRDELEKVVTDRLHELELKIEHSALRSISLVSAGLPYYTHLLGQHAACAAIDLDAKVISQTHMDLAMRMAIEDSERERQTAYYLATKSRNPRSTFAQTLAACTMASNDDFGYFTAASVREPLIRIKNALVEIPNYIGHLDRFNQQDYGSILQTSGPKHQRRYRFADPLMQPFVIIKSLESGVFTIDDLKNSEPQYGSR